MNDNESMVRVNIFGQEYTVKAPANSDYIRDIADYVNGKMIDIQNSLSTEQSATRIAILAAMNISDELFSIRQENEELSTTVESRLSDMIDLIDDSFL